MIFASRQQSDCESFEAHIKERVNLSLKLMFRASDLSYKLKFEDINLRPKFETLKFK